MIRQPLNKVCRRWRSPALLAGVAVAAALLSHSSAQPPASPSTTAPASRPNYRLLDTPWAQDSAAPIEWKSDWETTYNSNREKWAKELGGKNGELRLHVRLAHLLEAMLEKYPDRADKRAATYSELASHLESAGFRNEAGEYLKKAIEQTAGRPEAAGPILYAMVGKRDHSRAGGEALVEYAARRLIELTKVGALADTDTGAIEGLKAMAVVKRRQGRFSEAADALAALEDATGQDLWWKQEMAGLFTDAGHASEALPLLRDLAMEKEDRHAQERVTALAEGLSASAARFPGDQNLNNRWAGFTRLPFTEVAQYVDAVLQVDPSGAQVGPWEEGRYSSLWSGMDQYLLAQEAANPGTLSALRDAQAREAAKLLDKARAAAAGGSADEWLALYRRYPWASSVHGGLVEVGESLLRRGQPSLALRCFEDALSHAADPAVRQSAQAGVWLALAQGLPESRAVLEKSLSAAAAGSQWPWLGQKASVGEIRKQLLASEAEKGPDPFSGKGVRTLFPPPAQLPVAAGNTWPAALLADVPPDVLGALAPARAVVRVVEGGKVLVGGPTYLACYGSDLAKPVWEQRPVLPSIETPPQRPRDKDEADESYYSLPGEWRPAVAGGRVYARWGLNSTGQYLTSVVAFDVATGQMLWSSDNHAAWRGVRPVGDPAAADGRVYVLAIDDTDQQVVVAAPLWLVCMDADRGGAVLWKRRLAEVTPTLLLQSERTSGESKKDRDRGKGRVDLARYGNAVTVRDGAVYCSSNMGVTARVDGCDGVIEWAFAYPRARLATAAPSVVPRWGSAPVVAGERVVFAPRDRYGLFAIDCRTGRLAWDSPFAPSRDVVGAAGDVVLVSDRDELAAIEAATGAVRWTRPVEQGLQGRPRLDGPDVLAPTARGLLRIAAANGALLDERPWEGRAASGDFALRDGQLLTPAEAPADLAADAPRTATTAPANLELPLAKAWELKRRKPQLFVPPSAGDSDTPTGEFYVVSEGVLESVGADGRPRWRRSIDVGVEDLEWTAAGVLLIYPRQVEMIDAASGAVRWRTPTPFSVRRSDMAGGNLVICELGAERNDVAAIELSTGRITWHREELNLGGPTISGLFAMQVDADSSGETVHVLGRTGSTYYDVVLRPADGAIADYTALPNGFSPSKVSNNVAVVDGKLVAWFKKGAGKPAAASKKRRQQESEYGSDEQPLRVTGQWVQTRSHDPYRGVTTFVVTRASDANYRLTRYAPGVIRGERLYEMANRTVTVIDLPSQKELLRCVAPVTASIDHFTQALDFWEAPEAMFVLWGLERGPYPSQREATGLRLDRFDAKTGDHLGGQVLDAPRYIKGSAGFGGIGVTAGPAGEPGQTQLIRSAGGLLIVSDGDGVYAFSKAPDNTAPADGQHRPVWVSYRTAPTTRPAEALAQREGQAADQQQPWPLEPINGGSAAGQLLLGHDEENLYVAVAYDDGALSPRRGRGPFGGGDWLEVGLTTNVDSYHFGLAAGDRGQAVFEQLGKTAAAPAQMQASVRQDLATGRQVYELTVPLKAIVYRKGSERWRTLGVSLAVWDDKPAAGSRRVLAWGGGLDGPKLLASRQNSVYLNNLSRGEEQAALAVADKLPQLPESRQLLDDYRRLRATSPAAAVELAREYLKDHKDGPAAARTLEWLDQQLRGDSISHDPRPQVLKLAEEAGVAEPIRRRYSAVAGACLSQWVFLDGKIRPRMLMLQLNDGQGWEHRVSWGEFQSVWTGIAHTPSRRMVGPLPESGAWQELRVPLIWLDMHDKPLAGLSFGQIGGSRVVWDRTAIVVDGKETVLLDDAAPADSKLTGYWEWVNAPAKTGDKAHSNIVPVTADDAGRHDITFKNPAASPLPAPPAEAPLDAAAAVALLEQQLPRLGASESAVTFFRALQRLDCSDDPAKRLARYKWFLTQFPIHPQSPDILGETLAFAKATNQGDPVKFVDGLIDECKTPLKTRYAFRRKFTHPQRSFLTDWLVVGPFPNLDDRGLEFPFSPEFERPRLDAAYQGATDVVRWRPYKSKRDFVDLGNLLVPNENAVAYAACWVFTEKPRAASLEVGSDDGAKVWVNRRLVHSQHTHDYAERGDHRTGVFLTAGWNELLVKVEQTTGDWGFFLELVDSEGRGPLEPVKVSTTPP